jgi:diaminohydroxyphosphoribosylaminopyrimidine deaminase/5-amino-6-(5-phosphoribosylamino)uracil reductase
VSQESRAGIVSEDDVFMEMAFSMGRRGLGLTAPNPSVGCVIVRNGIVVGRGVTQPGGRPHAETVALAQAGAAARGATAYVTLEPCSHVGRTGPCADALARAGVARVVGAIRDPDTRVAGRGFAMLRSYGLSVTEGVLEDKARDAHIGHFTRVRLGRPAVTLKLALSADGKVAGPGGVPVRITGADSDAQVHGLRHRHDAIAVGIGTVLRDDPQLTVRLPGCEHRALPRIIFDSDLRLPLSSRLVATVSSAPLTVIAAENAPGAAEAALKAAGATVLRVPRRDARSLALGDALRLLGTLGLTRLFIEGGPTLASALVNADLVDEYYRFVSPASIGPEGTEGLTASAMARLSATLTRTEVHRIAADNLTIFRRS